MGGVVNIITKQAAAGMATEITAEAGENGLGALSLNHGGRRGRFSYWLSFSHQGSDSWPASGDFEPVEGAIVYRGPSSVVPTVLHGDGDRTNSDVLRARLRTPGLAGFQPRDHRLLVRGLRPDLPLRGRP
jgi:outer membrane receptor protein involved in Fe transport